MLGYIWNEKTKSTCKICVSVYGHTDTHANGISFNQLLFEYSDRGVTKKGKHYYLACLIASDNMYTVYRQYA